MRVRTEEFINEILDAIRTGRNMTELRDKYRNIDVLLIDDIQFITNKESCTVEFINTFNAVYEAGGQIVVTGNVSLWELQENGFSEPDRKHRLYRS